MNGGRHIASGTLAGWERLHHTTLVFGGHIIWKLASQLFKSAGAIIDTALQISEFGLYRGRRIARGGQGVGNENLGEINFCHCRNTLLHIYNMIPELGAHWHRDLANGCLKSSALERINHIQNGEKAQLTTITMLYPVVLRIDIITCGRIVRIELGSLVEVKPFHHFLSNLHNFMICRQSIFRRCCWGTLNQNMGSPHLRFGAFESFVQQALTHLCVNKILLGWLVFIRCQLSLECGRCVHFQLFRFLNLHTVIDEKVKILA